MNRRTRTVVGAWLLVVLAGVGTEARELSFDERVDARVALESVYHRYRTGTALSSEQALSRERLETIVHRQIARSTFVDTQRNRTASLSRGSPRSSRFCSRYRSARFTYGSIDVGSRRIAVRYEASASAR